MSDIDLFAGQVVTFASELITEAVAHLDPKPDRVVSLAPGSSVAWDDNCDGMLWTRIVSVLPPPGFTPSGTAAGSACAMPWFLLTMELGVIRCAAVVDDNGIAPPAADIIQDGVQGTHDMAALLQVLRCWEHLRGLVSWTPQGPEGGYHGGSWTFQVRLPNCLTCGEDHG